MTTKRRIWILAVLGVVAAVGALAGTKALQIGAMIKAGKSFVPPPESVTTAKVEATEWQASRPAIGSLVAVRSVTLASELPGRVNAILFDSGEAVKRGAELVRLDTSLEQAQLAAAQADATLARQSLERARLLRGSGTNTPADEDGAEARAKQAEAVVAQLGATIGKKTIRAPFDGRIGIRQVELGQIIGSSTPLATLQSVDPIQAEFWLPQQTLGELKLGIETSLRTDAFPGVSWKGRISTINPEVDLATRNVRVRASFSNQGGLLRPGMFGNVEVLSADRRPVLIIPATAVLYAPYGDSVFAAVEKKDPEGRLSLVAQQKFVRLGERRGDLVAVESGLAVGEVVVSSGAFKLRNGSSLVVKNDLAPDVQANPQPRER